jgi:hypothetical protein
MVSLARTLSRALMSFVALAAAALAQGALATESGRDGLRIPEAFSETPAESGPAVPSYLDAARLPQVEEAYRARAARADGEERREPGPGAREPENEPDRAMPPDAEPPREPGHVPRLAATGPEGREGPAEGPEGGEAREAEERPGYPPDAAGWAMHAGDGPTDADGPRKQPAAAGTEEIEALLEAAERRAAQAEARLAVEATARRRTEKTAEAAEKAPDVPRASRHGKRQQADRRDDDVPKPVTRESRRGTRPQADREPAGSRRSNREGEKRAAVAESSRQRGEKASVRAPHPPPVEMDPPPPPRPSGLSGLFGLFAPSAPEPPPPAPPSGRPTIPDAIQSRGWY